MIARLSGTVLDTTPRGIIVSVGGVGFMVNTTVNFTNSINEGDDVSLYTFLSVKEDALDLYGFANEYEKIVFELLISVSGIGPRSALAALDTAGAAQLVAYVVEGNTVLLTKIPGIGKKTAERIVLELKEKMTAHYKDTGSTIPTSDVVLALEALGYNAHTIHSIIGSIPNDIPLNDQIRHALQLLKQ